MPQLALAILLELFATLTITCFSLQMQHTIFPCSSQSKHAARLASMCVCAYCKKFDVVDVTPSGDEKHKPDPL